GLPRIAGFKQVRDPAFLPVQQRRTLWRTQWSTSFCTRRLASSPTRRVFSPRQSMELTAPNSLSSLPARPNLPRTVPSRRILYISPATSISFHGLELETYRTGLAPLVIHIAWALPKFENAVLKTPLLSNTSIRLLPLSPA